MCLTFAVFQTRSVLLSLALDLSMKFEHGGSSAAGLWQFHATLWQFPTINQPHWRPHESTENYPVVSGEFMNIANGYRRRLGWSNRIVRRGKGRRHDELLEAGR